MFLLNTKLPFKIYIKGVSLSLTATLGIIGNMLTWVVLRRISLDNVFNQVDLIFILSCKPQRILNSQQCLLCKGV